MCTDVSHVTASQMPRAVEHRLGFIRLEQSAKVLYFQASVVSSLSVVIS